MFTARNTLAAAVVGGRLYAVGGFDGGNVSANEEFDPGTAQSFLGLTPNTQYNFTAKARNLSGSETVETPVASTYTLAALPSTATPSFPAVYQTSATLQWTANNNPGGTEFRALASTAPDFNA